PIITPSPKATPDLAKPSVSAVKAATPASVPLPKKNTPPKPPLSANQKAIEEYKLILQKDPGNAAANLKLARLYFISGYEDLSEKVFLRQEEIDPETIEASNNLGFREFKDKKYGRALNSFKEVLRVDPKNPRARFGIVTVYAKQSFFFKAIRLAESALKDNPRMAPFQNKLAELYARKRMKINKAISLSQESLTENPLADKYLSTLATLYYLNGEKGKAISSIQKAISLHPENKLYKTQLWKFKNT
ncbi:MAG: tetratricopeptide repeat protein, partial [Nitrospinota bacterium]